MILSLLLACSGADAPAPPVTPPVVAPAPAPGPDLTDLSARKDQLNVIFIDVDAMRDDFLTPEFAPNLYKLEQQSIDFTSASSAASWTVPATMSIWTGMWPSRHHINNKLTANAAGEMVFSHLDDGIATFPDLLTKQGFRAAAFTGGAGVQARFGYDRGFEVYLDDQVFGGFDHSLPPATQWVDANKDAHFFLFLHGYDVHGQHKLLDESPRQADPTYTGKLDGSIEEQARLREEGLAAIQKAGDPPRLDLAPEDAAFLKAVYGAKVKEADARVGKMLDHLGELGLLDTSIIVVFADHGEEFGEHGYIDHGATLCEHQLHVPFFIHLPGGQHQVIDQPVSTVDLFPTVFDMLGINPPQGIDGRSLLPIVRGQKLDVPIYAETDYRFFVHLRSLKAAPKKLVLDLEDGDKELFDLVADPGEQADLGEQDPKTTYELEQSLRTIMLDMKTDPQDYLGIHQEPVKVY